MDQADWYARGDWRPEPLWQTLEQVATGPGRDAVVADESRRLPFPEFLRHARHLVAGLMANGLVRGDTVVVQSRNSVDAFALLIGCAAYGLVGVPLPAMFSAGQVEAVVVNAGARALVMLDERAGERLAGMGDYLSRLAAVFVTDGLAVGRLRPFSSLTAAVAPPAVPAGPDADALVLYSSGSTGVPKGVVHSGNTLRFAAETLGRFHQVGPSDRVLVALEFGFVGGTILGALVAFLAGAGVQLMRHWKPEEALRLIETERLSYTLLMPTHVYDVMNCPALAQTDCSSLTRGILAGVPRHVREDAARRFCARPLPMFGMSESIGHVTFAPDDPWDAVASLDGRALPGVEIAVRREDGSAAAPDEVGDLFLRGPNRLRRYLGNDALNREAIVADGWFRTGDRARLDAEGRMLFVGRAKEIIRRGGVTLVPGDIETALLKHPAIAEAAVVPVPDERLGEKACACLVLRPGAHLDLVEIGRHLEVERLARYQIPEELLLFDSLPRTPSLKVRRADLETEARRRLDRQAAQSS